jgi:hypothetical protein
MMQQDYQREPLTPHMNKIVLVVVVCMVLTKLQRLQERKSVQLLQQ